MGIRIEAITGTQFDDWDSYVDRASHALPFHRGAALESIARHHGQQVHPLVGYKGEEPIGLFPLFETTVGPFTAVGSPPVNTEIAYMGPVQVGLDGAKQRRIEKTRRRFVDAALEWVETELTPDLVHVQCASGFTDVRPFLWRDFEVTPTYTYVLSLDGDSDDAFASFSSDARRKIRRFEESDGRVEVGGADALGTINDLVRSRLAEKGLEHELPTALLEDLYERLGSERVRPYVCVVDGEIVGGTLALTENGTIYAWIGGAVPETDLSVNEALDWRIIRDGIEEGAEQYDFHGAMEHGVIEYKSKFNPDLTPLYEIERKSPGVKAASGLIRQMPNSVRSLID
jgi:hypothetical protein